MVLFSSSTAAAWCGAVGCYPNNMDLSIGSCYGVIVSAGADISAVGVLLHIGCHLHNDACKIAIGLLPIEGAGAAHFVQVIAVAKSQTACRSNKAAIISGRWMTRDSGHASPILIA